MISATLLGRLTADPQSRQAGRSNVVNFNVACDSTRKDRNGNSTATFVRVAVWGHQGDFVERYFHKGDPIFVTGELLTEEYVDRNGAHRTAVTLTAQNVSFVPQSPKARRNDSNNATRGNFADPRPADVSQSWTFGNANADADADANAPLPF